MKTYLYVLQSLTAMLQHRFDEAGAMETTSRTVHVKPRDPRDMAEQVVYRNAAGEIYCPGVALARAIREAAAAHKQRGSRKSFKYIVPATVIMLDEQLILRDSEGKALTKFEVDSRPVVIPATKGRVMRHRPRLNFWNLEGAVQIDDDNIDPDFVHQLFVEAGNKMGLLDNRPQIGGTNGRFIVVSWALLDQTEAMKAAAAAE